MAFRRMIEPLLLAPGQLREARRQTGKPILNQLREIVALRRYRVSAKEYFKYRLFDDARYTPAEKREFTGFRFMNTVYRTVNGPALVAWSGRSGSWDGMVDKVLFDCLMRAEGIPTPPILGVYDPDGSRYDGRDSLRTLPEVTELLGQLEGGFFIKPSIAHSGDGAVSVEQVEAGQGRLHDGRLLPIEEIARSVTRWPRTLIQERVKAHASLVEAVGTKALPTIRMVVLRRPEYSEVHRAVLRIPAGDNPVDNFGAGGGNFAASIELETGRLRAAYSYWGMDQVRQPSHPDTGVLLEGLVLPDWDRAVEMTLTASRILAGMRFQSWDVALCEDGPMVIEVNDMSGQQVLQLAGPPGMLDASLCAFLRECGFSWPYPWPSRANGSSGAS
jgi:Sugar-transfer associated ATP-grasp